MGEAEPPLAADAVNGSVPAHHGPTAETLGWLEALLGQNTMPMRDGDLVLHVPLASYLAHVPDGALMRLGAEVQRAANRAVRSLATDREAARRHLWLVAGRVRDPDDPIGALAGLLGTDIAEVETRFGVIDWPIEDMLAGASAARLGLLLGECRRFAWAATRVVAALGAGSGSSIEPGALAKLAGEIEQRLVEGGVGDASGLAGDVSGEPIQEASRAWVDFDDPQGHAADGHGDRAPPARGGVIPGAIAHESFSVSGSQSPMMEETPGASSTGAAGRMPVGREGGRSRLGDVA